MSSVSDRPVNGPVDGQALIELVGMSLCFRKYGSASPSLKQAFFNRLLRRSYSKTSDFWLFRDLNIRIEHGERVGVIGPNGAGKSALLKVISGIYGPATGMVRVVGMIAPLIELGAGLNPELSGRENVFLMGALLGFGPGAMRDKVEHIIEFAGLPEFAETPIKYYSTGMLLRLAFSIATDVDPEILLVDEVFAGGDVAFVKKATNRMHELMGASKIVILVSHNLKLIREMCTRVIWIDHGSIVEDGNPETVCSGYERCHGKL